MKSLHKKLKAIQLSLLFLLALLVLATPLKSYAESASATTKIGISFTVKASPQCDYALGNLQGHSGVSSQSTSNGYKNLSSSSCDVSHSKLQQQLDQVAYTSTNQVINPSTRASGNSLKSYRVFMTVQ